MYKYLSNEDLEIGFKQATKAYAALGVDVEKAIGDALSIPLSVHCWQGDDVVGFEPGNGTLTGGILATGNYRGRASTPAQLRTDIETAFALIPGKKKVNLHAFYAETKGKKVERDELAPEHFSEWISWAVAQSYGLDFNPTYFSHPLSASGYTLAHADEKIRSFWIRHGKTSHKIAAAMSTATGSAVVNNIWIPDGSKDYPADRLGPRERLKASLDEILATRSDKVIDTVESKLFGLGSEAYVVGSHEFYLAYAVSKRVFLCLDTGHFHPTETIVDKITALLPFVPGLLFHLSRGMRWDSDHVTTFSDDLVATFLELKRAKALSTAHFALDYFDASINRISAWVIGARAVRKAILAALLDPTALIQSAEKSANFGTRLALMEESKHLPLSAVWDELCRRAGSPVGATWINAAEKYDEDVLSKR